MRILHSFQHVDVTPLLSQVRCPMLGLHATGDLRVPFAEGRRLAGLIEQARFVPLASDNHLMVEQDPA